jgi:hypothetical protein
VLKISAQSEQLLALVVKGLTSSKKDVPYKPEAKHHIAFENIKRMLLSKPIFCNLVDEHATKYMFVDACTTTSTLGCTLMQKIDSSTDDKILPTCLNLDDKVHRIIFDKQLPYQPCKLITKFPVEPLKPTEVRTTPPDISPRDKWLGFTKETIHDSFSWSVISCYVTYGCKIPESILELREMASKQIRKGILGIKLKDVDFNNSQPKYKQWMTEFLEGQHGMDRNFIVAQALAVASHRPFIFVSTLEIHKEQPIFKFNSDSTKPPLIFGVYQIEDAMGFLPFFYNKNLEFSIESLCIWQGANHSLHVQKCGRKF